MLTTSKSFICFAKFTTFNLSSFLVSAPYLPIICSYPMFHLPTCPFRAAPRTILSYFNTISINSSRPCQKLFFSFMLLPNCGGHALTMFSINPFTSSFMAISLYETLFNSKTLSTRFSLPLSRFHFFFHQLHCRIVGSHFQYSSFYSLSILFSVDTDIYISSIHYVCQLSRPSIYCSNI